MARQAKEEDREQRIQMEIIVDAYGPLRASVRMVYLPRGYLALSLYRPLCRSSRDLAIGTRS